MLINLAKTDASLVEERSAGITSGWGPHEAPAPLDPEAQPRRLAAHDRRLMGLEANRATKSYAVGLEMSCPGGGGAYH
jgi:hypothetical protein